MRPSPPQFQHLPVPLQEVQFCSTRSVVPARILYTLPLPPHALHRPLPLQLMHWFEEDEPLLEALPLLLPVA